MMMIFNNKNNKLKNKNLYIIISVLFILVILLNNRDYIENNINKDKALEPFANNNNNNNIKIKKLEDKVKELKKTNNDITKNYFKLRKEEIKQLEKKLKCKKKEDPIKTLQKQQEIENDKASKNREQNDKMKINEMNKVANDYLEYQKNKGPEVNLLNIGKNIEDGLYKLTDNFSDNKKKFIDIFNGKFKSDNNVESFIIKPKMKTNKSTTNNIKNKINKGNNKRINNNNQIKKAIVVSEEEVVEEENSDTKELKEKFYLGNNSNEKAEDEEESELDEDLISYFTYVFENIYSLFKKYFNLYINKNNLFNLGNISKDSNTLIGGGILFIVISMGLYFIDISS